MSEIILKFPHMGLSAKILVIFVITASLFLFKTAVIKSLCRYREISKMAGLPLTILIIIISSVAGIKLFYYTEKSELLLNNILITAVILTTIWIGYYLIDCIGPFLKRITAKDDSSIDEVVIIFLRKTLRVTILIIGATLIAQSWGINVSGIIAGLGIGGLALALAAKDTAANLFGSITIMIDKPFSVGDNISTDRIEGMVKEIGFRSTRILTPESAVITVPNSSMSNSSIVNLSRIKNRKIVLSFFIRYHHDSHDLSAVLDRIEKMLTLRKDILSDKIQVYIGKVSNTGIEIILQFFSVYSSEIGGNKTRSDVNLSTLAIFDESGIELSVSDLK